MKMQKILWIITIVTALSVFSLFLFLLFSNYQEKQETMIKDPVNEIEQQSNSQTDYAFETCYTGEPHLSDKLFQIPFRKSDLYIRNKDLVNDIGIENAEVLISKAKQIAEIIFNTPYKEKTVDSVSEELSEYLTKGIFIRSEDGEEFDGRTETAKAINEWFVNTKTTMESSLQTDKCMVYYDHHCIIVRGLLTYAIYESEDMTELEKTFGRKKMQYGEKYTCVMEFCFIPDESRIDYESYVLSAINVISVD